MSNYSLRPALLSRCSIMCFVFGAFTLAALTSGVRAGHDMGESQVKLTVTAGKIDKDGRQSITIKMHISDGWHAYANPVKNEDLEPNQTVVKITSAKKLEDVSVSYPAGQRQTVLKDSYQVYEGNVEILATVKRAPGDTGPLDVTVNYVTCNDKKGICLPPEAVKLQVK
jgi:DsbC/DsbD-like thiol-disulfide interchange protein